MYSLDEYGDMIHDAARFGGYARAIAQAVRPGDAAVDIGCGSGALAMLACRAGARRVFAFESGEILDMARQLAAANGFADRIVFFAGDSRRMELPERVRVVISDLRGALPFFDGAIASIEDARRRFLAPDGVMIPQRDTVWAALVEAYEEYARLTEPWSHDGQGLDLTIAREQLLNSIYKAQFTREQLLTEPRSWCALDYPAGANPRAAATLRFRAARAGTARGVCLWFDTQLWGDAGFSCAPGTGKSVYGQIFLPWLASVPFARGQEVTVDLHADLVGEDYVWRWNTCVTPPGRREPLHFVQSSFFGGKLTKDALRHRTADYTPVLTESEEADRWILDAMDGKQTLDAIARGGATHFPSQFRSFQDAFSRVASLADKHAR